MTAAENIICDSLHNVFVCVCVGGGGGLSFHLKKSLFILLLKEAKFEVVVCCKF